MELTLSDTLKPVIDDLLASFPEQVQEVYQSSGDTFVRIDPAANIEICRYLKEEHHFTYLTDIFGTDRFTSSDRFEVVYNLVSLHNQERLFVKAWLEEESPEIKSMTPLWRSANWFERQTYDMFGIVFTGHPDLRRMYMPEDFNYFPLRKEFPLLGIPGSIPLPSSTPDTE